MKKPIEKAFEIETGPEHSESEEKVNGFGMFKELPSFKREKLDRDQR